MGEWKTTTYYYNVIRNSVHNIETFLKYWGGKCTEHTYNSLQTDEHLVSSILVWFYTPIEIYRSLYIVK